MRKILIDGFVLTADQVRRAYDILNTPEHLTPVRHRRDLYRTGIIITGFIQEMYVKGSGLVRGDRIYTVLEPCGSASTLNLDDLQRSWSMEV